MNNTLKDLTMKMKKEDLSNNVMILLEIINEQDQKIDKANKILSNILVIKRSDGNYGAVKNTTKQEVYKTICMLNEVLETPHRANHNLLGGREKDIEFDVLKALNTDLPDDIEMG